MRKADFSLSLEMTHKGRIVRSVTDLAHFERHQVAVGGAAGFVVGGDLPVSPAAGEVVCADEKQRFVIGRSQLERAFVGADGEHGGGGVRTINSDQAPPDISGGARVSGGTGSALLTRVAFGGV